MSGKDPRANGINADRVAPRLYIGAYESNTRALRAAGFTKVIRVAKELPHDYPLDDSSDVSAVFLEPAMHAAAEARNAIVRGQRVLITCAMGINRSAFVAAVVMIKLYRMPPQQAIAQIRAARRVPASMRYALSNRHFVGKLLQLTPGEG